MPDLRVEAIKFVEHMVKLVDFIFDLKLIFFPSNQADVHGMVSRTSSIGKRLVGSL